MKRRDEIYYPLIKFCISRQLLPGPIFYDRVKPGVFIEPIFHARSIPSHFMVTAHSPQFNIVTATSIQNYLLQIIFHGTYFDIVKGSLPLLVCWSDLQQINTVRTNPR